MPSDTAPAGLTVAEVAARYRVGPDKVRRWLVSGELAGINTASVACGKPRWIVLPDALAAFEARRSAATPRTTRKKRKPAGRDYYPDAGEGVRHE